MISALQREPHLSVLLNNAAAMTGLPCQQVQVQRIHLGELMPQIARRYGLGTSEAGWPLKEFAPRQRTIFLPSNLSFS